MIEPKHYISMPVLDPSEQRDAVFAKFAWVVVRGYCDGSLPITEVPVVVFRDEVEARRYIALAKYHDNLGLLEVVKVPMWAMP